MTDRQMVTVPGPEESVQVITVFDQEAEAALQAYRSANGEMVSGWANEFSAAGDYLAPAIPADEDYFRVPTLTVPRDFYTQVRWAKEYHREEALVNALFERDINSAVKPVEFQLPEDKAEPEKRALEKWRKTLNRDIGHHGGLNAYNRALAVNTMLTGLTVTLANWGPLRVGGKFYTMPKVLVDLDPLAIVPDIDSLTGRREYYLKLSASQADAIQNGTAEGFLQIIPDAASRIVTNIEFIVSKLKALDYGWDPRFLASGPFLKLPIENGFVISFNSLPHDRWPTPSLVSIFNAIAMKRKLQLTDWAIADGIVNMLMVWEFPPGTKPSDAKKIVGRFIAGGRVQAHAVPAGVKVTVVTPPNDILNSSEKFWVPISDILAHFDYPLNSKSRGAGDLDSGPLDLAANKARLDIVRESLVAHNNYWLEQIAERNGWDFEPEAVLPAKDLDNSDAFRSFILTLFDRGPLSYETLLEAAGTSVEREAARRKKEKAANLDETFEIRPTFAQTAAPASAGRTPDDINPKTTSPKGINDKQTRSTRNRPNPSAQSQTQTTKS